MATFIRKTVTSTEVSYKVVKDGKFSAEQKTTIPSKVSKNDACLYLMEHIECEGIVVTALASTNKTYEMPVDKFFELATVAEKASTRTRKANKEDK